MRKLITFAVTLLAMFAVPSSTSALVTLPFPLGVQDMCAGTHKIWVYENGANDNSDGDDEMILCFSDYSNLNAFSHTLPGNCNKGFGLFSTTWNDCVSSVKVGTLAGGSYVCFYRSALETPNNDLLIEVNSSNDNITHTFGGANNDALSGIESRGSSCPDPAP